MVVSVLVIVLGCVIAGENIGVILTSSVFLCPSSQERKDQVGQWAQAFFGGHVQYV